jgi:general secretion pathway protein A
VTRKRLAAYGLKWNPFTSDVPVEAIQARPRVQSFLTRMETLAYEGGFALVTGEHGTGKSATLRLLADHLTGLRDVRVGVLTRPQCSMADFYRELGDLFGVELSPHNRWAGTKVLRERWRSFIDASLVRPVVLIDEAQDMVPPVLNELRILMSTELDSVLLLTVVLAGDQRLPARLGHEALLAVGSRIRTRLLLEGAPPQELAECLRHVLATAGHPRLMTDGLVTALSEHAGGNHRVLMSMGADLLAAGLERELDVLDEKLFLEVFDPGPKARPRRRGPVRS